MYRAIHTGNTSRRTSGRSIPADYSPGGEFVDVARAADNAELAARPWKISCAVRAQTFGKFHRDVDGLISKRGGGGGTREPGSAIFPAR